MTLTEATATIKSTLAEIGDPTKVDEDERLALLAACDQLKDALESPMETILRMVFGPYMAMTARLAIDTGLFDAFAAAQNGELRIDELVQSTKMEKTLLNRWLPLLVGYRFLDQTGDNSYKALPRAALFATGSPLVGSLVHFGTHHETIVQLPAYFEANGYKNPTDAHDGPFQFAHDTKDQFFDWLVKRPREQAAFDLAMSVARQEHGQEWFEVYPVGERLMGSSNTSKDEVLLVDVGGGRGHELAAFKAKFPDLPGRLILEDLPTVIDGVKDMPRGIELLKHDFFTPQPVKGAKAYYMRTVLHDWPDKQAEKILEGIKEVMSPSSLLLVNEQVIPDSGMPFIPAHWDLTMMFGLAALERTRKQWVDLLGSVGLKIIAFYEVKSNLSRSSTLIEAMLA